MEPMLSQRSVNNTLPAQMVEYLIANVPLPCGSQPRLFFRHFQSINLFIRRI